MRGVSISGDLSCVSQHLLDERLHHPATVGEVISHLLSNPGLALLDLLESLLDHGLQPWLDILGNLVLLGQDFFEFLSDESPLLTVLGVSLVKTL